MTIFPHNKTCYSFASRQTKGNFSNKSRVCVKCMKTNNVWKTMFALICFDTLCSLYVYVNGLITQQMNNFNLEN